MAIGPRRSRSNDGTLNRIGRVMPIDPKLFNSLMVEFLTKREPRKPQVFHGPKPARGAPATRLTDEQVLAIRKMRDWLGMTPSQIVEATGEPWTKLDPIVNYRNRVHLDPGPRPVPTNGDGVSIQEAA
jgi:hypothetical protein